MRTRWPLVLLLPLIALGPAPSVHAAPSTARQPRLLFSSAVVAGDEMPYGQHPDFDIYSLSSSGKLAQLTFTGGEQPVPSPNGRLIAFVRGNDLWLMSPDGRRQRLLAKNASQPAWTPDSRRLGFVSIGAGSESFGIRVIRANGTGSRWLVRGQDYSPAWSPDGRTLAYVLGQPAPTTPTLKRQRLGTEHAVQIEGSSEGSVSWSPDGRWLAFGCDEPIACGMFVAHPDGSDRRTISAGSWPAWSPHGQVLAYLADGSIRTFNLATGSRRVLVTYPASPFFPGSLAWSPDGSRIAYELFYFESESSELYTVSLRGRVHALGGYPEVAALAWTTPPTSLRYQTPQPVGPVAAGNELRFRVPVDELSADGDAVAYRTCGVIGVWRPSPTKVTTVRGELPLCNSLDDYLQFYSLALAGDQVAWGEIEGGGTSQASTLYVAPVAPTPSVLTLAHGPHFSYEDDRSTARVGDLLGAGSLLTFSSWAYCDDVYPSSCSSQPVAQRPLVSQTLWRMREPSWAGACPGTTGDQGSARCQQLRAEPGPLRPLDVDAGRIVVSGNNSTLVLDSNGTQLLSLPVSTQAAQLAVNDLVLLVPGQLRDYDATTGALLHTWPLPNVTIGGFCGVPAGFCGSPRLVLEGAASGLAAYLLDGKLHLLRLRDGADTVVGDATAAQLDDSGLFYAYTTTGNWPGRIRFVPFDQLPLR